MKAVLQRIFDNLLIGVVGILPIVFVIQIVIYIERLLRDFVLLVHGRYENPIVTILLFASAIALLIYFGHLLKHGKADLLYHLESFINHVPLIGSIYRVLKKLFQMFLGSDSEDAREIVYVEYPKDGMWVPAYVTNRSKDSYILYVPTSPNPTSGFTVIVDKSKVVHSKMDIGEVSSFIISLGVELTKPDEASELPNRSRN